MTGRVYCLTDLDCQLLIDEFDSRDAAEAALWKLVRSRPGLADHVGILRFDQGGRQIGSPILAEAGLAVR